MDRLTPRWRQCLWLAAQGYSSREIGETLGISFQTAKNHLYNVRIALKARNTTHAVYIAMQLGELEPNKDETDS